MAIATAISTFYTISEMGMMDTPPIDGIFPFERNRFIHQAYTSCK